MPQKYFGAKGPDMTPIKIGNDLNHPFTLDRRLFLKKCFP